MVTTTMIGFTFSALYGAATAQARERAARECESMTIWHAREQRPMDIEERDYLYVCPSREAGPTGAKLLASVAYPERAQ